MWKIGLKSCRKKHCQYNRRTTVKIILFEKEGRIYRTKAQLIDEGFAQWFRCKRDQQATNRNSSVELKVDGSCWGIANYKRQIFLIRIFFECSACITGGGGHITSEWENWEKRKEVVRLNNKPYYIGNQGAN